MSNLSIVREFGAQLENARDPRRRGLTTALPLAAIVIAAVGVALSSAGTDPALAVSRDAGSITVTLHHPSVGAPQLTKDLRAAGVRGRVVAVPTNDGSVGKWLGATHSATSDAATLPLVAGAKPLACPDVSGLGSPIRGTDVNDKTIRVPDAPGERASVVLLVGRRAVSTDQPLDPTTITRNGDGDAVLHCHSPG